jgi:hypothetical protein
MSEIQGLSGFPQPDPLWHRTFGAMITAVSGERIDDLQLRSPESRSHCFSIFVLTDQRSTPDRWLTEMSDSIR